MKTREEKDIELELLTNDVKSLIEKREVNKALLLTNSLIRIAKINESYTIVGTCYNLKGFIHFNLNQINLALNFYKKALNFFQKDYEKNYLELIHVSNSLGVIYRKLGELKNALEIYYYSIELGEKYNLSNSTVYNNIALIYIDQKEFKKALYNYKLAVKIENESLNINKQKVIKYLTNIANLYFNLKKYNQAKEIFKKTLSFCQKNDEFEVLITSLKGLGLLLTENNQFKEAENYFKNAIKISLKINYKVLLIDLYLYLSIIYSRTNRLDLQKDNLLNALKITKESDKTKEISVLEELHKYYLDTNNYKDAHETLARIHLLHKEKAQKEKDEKLLELQEQFEAQQKDKLIIQEQKFNKRLQESNQKLLKALADQQALELHIKSLQLQLSPHFIFNTLQSIQGYIFNKSAFETSDYLAEFAVLMRSVLKASRELAIPLELELSLLKNYVSLEQKRFNNSFKYQEHVADEINIENTLIPSFLIQPFIENAILHGVSTQKNGAIYLVIRKKKRGYYIHIVDNGMGREAAALLEKKTHQGKSMALDILTERCSLSKDSPNFSYNYKIFNRISNTNNTGTHVVLSVENKKMKS